MPRKHLPRILSPAPRGSKRDWRPLTFEVPPDVAERLAERSAEEGRFRGDILHLALVEYLDRPKAAA